MPLNSHETSTDAAAAEHVGLMSAGLQVLLLALRARRTIASLGEINARGGCVIAANYWASEI